VVTAGVHKLREAGNLFDGFPTSVKVSGAKENVEFTTIQESGLRDQIRLDVGQSAQTSIFALQKMVRNI
jgi:hypothetical protein